MYARISLGLSGFMGSAAGWIWFERNIEERRCARQVRVHLKKRLGVWGSMRRIIWQINAKETFLTRIILVFKPKSMQ